MDPLCFAFRPRVFPQTPCFPPDPVLATPRVFHRTPCFPHPGTPYPRTSGPPTPGSRTPCPGLTEKQTYFSDQKCNDSQLEKSMSGDGWCRTKHRVTDLHGQQIESLVNFFVMLRDALLVLQVTLSAKKKKRKETA